MMTNVEPQQEIQMPPDDFALMAEEKAAAFIGVTRRALQNWRINGNGPKYVKISARCVRYRRIDLIQWSEKRLQTSTSKDAFAISFNSTKRSRQPI